MRTELVVRRKRMATNAVETRTGGARNATHLRATDGR